MMSDDFIVSQGCNRRVTQCGLLQLWDMLVCLNRLRRNAREPMGCHWQGDDIPQRRDRAMQHDVATQ